jgi:hypothetical protein
MKTPIFVHFIKKLIWFFTSKWYHKPMLKCQFRALKSKGSSLVQVMVSVAIMSVISLGVATMISYQHKELKALGEKLLTKELESQMKNMFSDSDYCNCVFRGKFFDTTAGSEAIVTADQITRLRTGYSAGPPTCTVIASDFIPPAGTQVPGSTMDVGTIGLTNMQLISPANYKADLAVTFSNSVRSIKGIKTSIQFTINPALGTSTARPFVSCASSPVSPGATIKGFCTPVMSFDNADIEVCPVIAGFSERKLTGVHGGIGVRHTSCCYVPSSSTSPGWCSSNMEGWSGSFSGCGASTASYAVTHVSGAMAGQNDTHSCCFIPTTPYVDGPGASNFGTAFMRADSGWLDCGGPYTYYDRYFFNYVTGGVGRTISCTFVSK